MPILEYIYTGPSYRVGIFVETGKEYEKEKQNRKLTKNEMKQEIEKMRQERLREHKRLEEKYGKN